MAAVMLPGGHPRAHCHRLLARLSRRRERSRNKKLKEDCYRFYNVGHARCVVPAVKTPRDRPRPGFVSTALRGSAHEIYKGKGRGRGSFRTSYETVHKNST